MKLFLGKIWKTISWKKDSSNIKAALLLFSCSVMSNSLQLQGMQHARLPCPSPSPGVYSYSCPLSQWCHPTISSSVIPFSSCSQSFPASESFPVSQLPASESFPGSRLFTSGGQSIGASASASVLPMKIQGLFPFGMTGLISLPSKGLQHHSLKASILWHSVFFLPSSHIHRWLLVKP